MRGTRGDGWLALGPFRTIFIPKSTVFLLPFVNVFYRQFCGFSEELIGVMCALKPWVAAPAGSLIVSAADASQRHMAVLLAVYLVAFLGRSAMAFFAAFSIQLALALLTEAAASPLGALIDASVMASATDDGGYGRIRMYASVGWGLTAPLAGWVVAAFGLRAAFLCFTCLVGLSLFPTALLPMEVLAAPKQQSCRDRSPDGQVTVPSEASGQHLCCQAGSSEKLGMESEGSQAAQEGQPGAISVHISGSSQPFMLLAPAGSGALLASKEASGQGWDGGKPALLQLPKSWSIRAGLHCLGERHLEGAGTGSNGGATTGVINLVADAQGGSRAASALPDSPGPEHPLLSPRDSLFTPDNDVPALDRLPGACCSSSSTCPLEIAPASHAPSKARLGGREDGAAAAAGCKPGPSVWQGIRGLLTDIRVLMFFFMAFLMGIGNGCIGYLFLYLDELGASGTLMGLCLSFNCMAEVPVFYFSGKLLGRLGVERALNVAMGAYVLRLLCYLALPLLPSPWCVLPVELLQGCTFALAWSSGTVYVKHISPPHLRSTVQSIYQGLYTGIGAGLGGLVGGLLYGSFGATALFRTAALALAAGWLGTLVVLRMWGGVRGASTAQQAQQGDGDAAGHSQKELRPSDDEGEGEDAALLHP